MTLVLLDPDASRRTASTGFEYPLGVYPVEPVASKPGYVEKFEAADGAEPFIDVPDAEDWEEWPDRFMFDVLLPAPRLPAFLRTVLTLLPTRVYPILDVLGNDAYREIDPYIAYDLVGLDRLMNGLIEFGPWLFEDGLVGFGAMSIEPFVYVFVDEHKIVTVRVQLDLKEKLEKILAAFDLEPVDEIAGPDSASHEHRGVLVAPAEDPSALSAEEAVEKLRTDWCLELNVAGETNVDDAGNDLGKTPWRCVIRCGTGDPGGSRYAEVLLVAGSLDEAEELAVDAIVDRCAGAEGWVEIEPVVCDRLTAEGLGAELGREPPAEAVGPGARAGVLELRWPEGEPVGGPADRTDAGGPGAGPSDGPARGSAGG